MLDCTTDRYASLYAPWLTDAEVLLRLADLQEGERLLDLCGGTGAVSQAAMKHCKPSAVTLLDLKPRPEGMIVANCEFTVAYGQAENLIGNWPRHSYDVVVCRQALGYLDLNATMRAVEFVLAPGGRFAFNSFHKPEPFRWKHYYYGGAEYVEAHLFLFGCIMHLQGKLWEGFDVTRFRYHSPQRILEAAELHFHVDVIPRGRGLHWLCRKKGETCDTEKRRSSDKSATPSCVLTSATE